MNPLDAATPRALFGDAVGDARALKRAYAQLIRTWTPEGHPEPFRHIRALYEAALAELERGPAPVAAVLDPEAERAWTDARVAELAEEGLDAALATLEERARAGSVPALMTAAGLLEGVAPERTLVFLAQVAEAGAKVACEVGRVVLNHRLDAVDDPAWARLVAAAPDDGARARMAVAEVSALARLDRHDAAWDRWEALEAEIRRGAPREWAALAFQVLRRVGPRRPAADVDRWIDRFGSAELKLDDGLVTALCDNAADALALAQAEADAAFPRELLALVRALVEANPWERVLLLRHADRPERLAPGSALAAAHPGVAALFQAHVGGMAGREAALAAWRAGTNPACAPVPEAALARIAAVRSTIAAEEEARDRAARDEYQGRSRRATFELVAAVGAVVGGASAGDGTAALLGFGIAVLVIWHAHHLSKGNIAPDVAKRLAGPRIPDARLGEALLDACRAEGLWVHEIAAHFAGDAELAPVVDELVSDPLADLAVVGDAHARRVATEQTRRERAAMAEAS